jgi:hypothetical protein
MSQFENLSMRKIYHEGKESIYGITPREKGESYYNLTPWEEEGESFYGKTPREASESSYSSYSSTPQSKIYSTNNPYQSFSEFRRERTTVSPSSGVLASKMQVPPERESEQHYIQLKELNLPISLDFTSNEKVILNNFQRIILSSIKFLEEHDKENSTQTINNMLLDIILNLGELRHSTYFLNKIEHNLGQEAKLCYESILNLSKKELKNEGSLSEALSEMTCFK